MVQHLYNKRAKSKSINVGDWVLHKTLENKVETTFGKLVATWETPYIIYDITLNGSYKIEKDGIREDLSWNSKPLKNYYFWIAPFISTNEWKCFKQELAQE